MGGEIGVDSTVGEGSRFWFTVRYDAARSEPVAAVFSRPDMLKGKRVIVVDDTAINRRAIAGQLESYGIIGRTIAEPGDMLAALRAAQDDGEPFDIAILDQNMPGTSGIALARSIRSVRRFGDLKLILATSVGLPNPSDDARHVGFDAFLTKPLKRATLIDALCKVLGLESAGATPDNPVWSSTSEDTAAPLNILVAEDNMINQQLISALLTKWGHKVTLVETGFAAVTNTLARNYDLVLMDIQMPGMSGIEAAARIRRAPASRSKTPIIALTAHVLEGIRDEVLEAGMQDHVSKPIDPVELALAIDRVMSTGAHHRAAKSAPEKVPAGDPSVLDEGLLDRLELQIGRPMVAELANMLLDQTPPKLAALREAVAISDSAATRQLAHDICATAGNLGAFTVVNLSRQLETMGKNGVANAPPQLISEIEQSFDAAAKLLQARYQ